MIKLIKVPLNAPNGDKLADPISCIIKEGYSLLFIGPNGCGKSSLYRIIAQLWPQAGGELIKPDPSEMVFLPQKPYLPPGTLRDQIIYPDLESKWTDEELQQLMDEVDLTHLFARENENFDSVKPWVDVLSGGERQKISFARIFYHKPKFAILDESSSAISMDFEHILYEKCRELGITMFTISQRESLYEFHNYVLKFDGEGNWQYEKVIHEKEYDYRQI